MRGFECALGVRDVKSISEEIEPREEAEELQHVDHERLGAHIVVARRDRQNWLKHARVHVSEEHLSAEQWLTHAIH